MTTVAATDGPGIPGKPAAHFIVVGVDGSDSAIDALRWAARQAELTGASLKVLTAWQVPMAYGTPLSVLGDYDPADNAAQVLTETVTEADIKLPVETEVIQGSPAACLVEASADADLLVVGRRGHGELVDMVLGSVSAYVVAHAHCPVAVIHHSDRHAAT
jgi:nucleotide-binding universal stress UspA family protein